MVWPLRGDDLNCENYEYVIRVRGAFECAAYDAPCPEGRWLLTEIEAYWHADC